MDWFVAQYERQFRKQLHHFFAKYNTHFPKKTLRVRTLLRLLLVTTLSRMYLHVTP